MSDFQEKMPTSVLGLIIFLFIEILMIVCLIPNSYIDKGILKEQEWGEMLMGSGPHQKLIDDTNSLYTFLMLDSGVNQTVKTFFVPTAEERARSKEWEGLGNLWLPFIESRGEAVAKVIYHVYYRSLLLLMWAPYMIVVLVPSVFGGYMSWNIKRYNFDHSSPFLNTYSSKLLWLTVTGILVSFIAPLPIPPMIIPVLIITVIPIACSMLIGNLPKRL
ncbi:DUF4400 domain-containing protein [Pseudomonas aeruginosa]